MNQTSAYVHESPGGRFFAMVRLPKDSHAKPILGKGGAPLPFKSAYEAQKAASDSVCAYWNGNLLRDGETLLGPRKRAEALFHQDGP